MGKLHLWRKNSYVRVEKEEPGCVWALFRILNYQRWYNVRKMLPYRKHKPHERTTKSKGIKPDGQYQISDPLELEGYDAIMLNSASVNSSASTALSTLIEEEDNSRKAELADQQPQLQEFEDDRVDLSTPTLLSLLKADPKLDSPRQRRLARSGTFPSPNNLHSLGFGRTPSKVENKHTEIWPVTSHENELRRAKSLRMIRSSSLNEPLDKFGDLFRSKSRKEMKYPSFSEKDFTSLGDHHHHHHLRRKSFSERLSLLETESFPFGSNEVPRLSLEVLNHLRESRVDSPRDFDSPKRTENSGASQLDENRIEDSFLEEQGQSNHQENGEQTADFGSVSSPVEAGLQEGETESAEIPLPEDSTLVSQTTSTFEKAEDIQCSDDQLMHLEEEEYNEQFEYVKHVLDVLGFLGGEDQCGAWESMDETLDPTLFDEIEVLCPFKPEPSTKDSVGMSSSNRKVLFHLIIEALLEIHEKSFAFHSPDSLSFSLHIHTMSKGQRRILEEVWEFVSKWLSWKPHLDPRLDALVARDLSKSSSVWKNSQTEIEYMGLDLEELIFDDLLEEILGC